MPVTQEGKRYCSLECANATSGLVGEEDAAYFDENELEGLYDEDE